MTDREDRTCVTQWGNHTIYPDYVLPPLFAVAAVTMIIPILIYINAFMKRNLKTTQLLFYSGVIFYIVIFIIYCLAPILYPTACHNHSLHLLIQEIIQFLYSLQGGMLLFILFIRLHFIFKNTSSLSLSKCTIIAYLFTLFLAVAPAYSGYVLYYHTHLSALGELLQVAAGFFYVIAIVWINGLFVYKLFKVHKLTKDSINRGKKGKLIHTITKETLLCFISTSFIILFITSYFLVPLFDSAWFSLMNALIWWGDLYTNFLSIFLSYNYFDKWYRKMCGCCHSKCHRFWIKCSNDEDYEDIMMNVVESTMDDEADGIVPSKTDNTVTI